MKNLIFSAIFAAVFAFTANAQVAKMTSVYTNLKAECQPESKVEADEVPFICKAVGGFRVRIVPAGAWAETIEIVDSRKETVASLGTHLRIFDRSETRRRMANGKRKTFCGNFPRQ